MLSSLSPPPKNPAVYEICGKIWYNQTGHIGQYYTSHAQCMLGN